MPHCRGALGGRLWGMWGCAGASFPVVPDSCGDKGKRRLYRDKEADADPGSVWYNIYWMNKWVNELMPSINITYNPER